MHRSDFPAYPRTRALAHLRTRATRRRWWGAAMLACAALAAGAPARAADQTVRGYQLTVANPASADGSRRRITVSAIEESSANTVVGVPGGTAAAFLEVIANGAHSTAQVFPLRPGVASTGRPFWRPVGTSGFRYQDPRGEQGPVKSVLIAKNGRGTFRLKAVILGAQGLLDVVPPNPGTDGFVILELPGGDRYCVQFGPEAVSRNRFDQFWRVRRPTAKGCPPQAPRAGELLALTYNVAGLPEGLSGSHPSVNTAQISPLLNAYELVVVQESWKTPDPNPLAPLRVYHEILEADALHPFKSPSMPLPMGTDPRRPSALVSDGLNHFSQFPFGEVFREMWTDCDPSAADCLSLKGFSATRMSLARGIPVDLYNLHAEAGSTANDHLLREQGMRQLAAFIDTYSAGRAVLVGGDFNLHTDREPDATTYALLQSLTGLTDVCDAVGCLQPSRIDKWLFRSSDTLTLTPLVWRNDTAIFRDGEGNRLSDHDPVAARFAWTLGGP